MMRIINVRTVWIVGCVARREEVSVTGDWNVIVGEHEIGERAFLGGPYCSRPSRETGKELAEFSFDDRRTLSVSVDWNSQDDKLFRYRPVVWYERSFSSESRADSKLGNRSAEGNLWSEEYPSIFYRAQTSMLENSEYVPGMSPRILKDFNSAKRNLCAIQEIYNRKKLISKKGEKKRAFHVLQKHYADRAMAGLGTE